MSIGVKYRSHVAESGWQDFVVNGETSGTVQQNTALEAFTIELTDIPNGDNVGVVYYALVQDLGWSIEEVNGGVCGSTGLGKHIEAIKIGLFGNDASKYDIFYRLHVQDRGWLQWSKNGELNGTENGNVQAEAIQIIVASASQHVYPVVDTNIKYEYIESVQDITPPPESAETLRARVVSIAQQEIGYRASSNSKYGLYYGNPGDYCADFDRWCFKEAGLSHLVPQTGYCPTAGDVWREQGRWRNRWYIPSNGDLIYFDYNGNGTEDHTGIVEGCDGETVCTIEGNTKSPTGVYRKYYDVGDSAILGYGLPDF